MWHLLKTEFNYHRATFFAYGVVIIAFAFFMPELPGEVLPFLNEIPIYVTFAMAFNMFNKAKKEDRERFVMLFPFVLRRFVMARILIVIPFILGLTVLSLNFPGNILEEIGQQSMFLNVVNSIFR